MLVTRLQVNQGARQTIEEFKREGHSMRAYVLVATILFVLLTLVQLTRLFLRWPVFVAGLSIPLWVSGVAAVVAGSLAIAGMRVLLRSRVPPVAI